MRSRAVKVVLWVVGIAAVIVLLFTVVFPRVERRFQDPTFGLDAGAHGELTWTVATAQDERSTR